MNLFIGHMKLLWLFTCDGSLEMVKYINSMPGSEDIAMGDGTTAFSIALAKDRSDLIKELISSKKSRDIELARYALQEPTLNKGVKQVLEDNIVMVTHEEPRIEVSQE